MSHISELNSVLNAAEMPKKREILNTFLLFVDNKILINFNAIIIMIVWQRWISQWQQELFKWLVLCASAPVAIFKNVVLIPRWLLLFRYRHVHKILFYSINFLHTVWDLKEPVINHLTNWIIPLLTVSYKLHRRHSAPFFVRPRFL